METTHIFVAQDNNGNEITAKISGIMVSGKSERLLMEMAFSEVLDLFKVSVRTINGESSSNRKEIVSKMIKIICQTRKHFINACQQLEKEHRVDILTNISESDLEKVINFERFSQKDLRSINAVGSGINGAENDIAFQIGMDELIKEMEKRGIMDT